MVAQGARRSGRPMSDALRDIGSLRALFSAHGLLAMFDAPWAVVYVGVIWLAHLATTISLRFSCTASDSLFCAR
jgi:ABC-type protease/lipase transport system fused ATPase/permease subunit